MSIIVRSLPFLQSISTGWYYDLDFLSLTLKNNTVLPLLIVTQCTKLYDLEARGSISIIPAMFFYYIMLLPRPLNSDIENQEFSLIMVIKCAKLYNYEAYGSVSICLQGFSTVWCYNFDLENQ
jgi:hypothetical protein